MYVDLAGLARYKSDFGAWARRSLLPKDAAAARVRTAKAGAVFFVPVQRTPLDVSVDFLFSETPPASGDKGPSNPSTITGVSSVKVTRCGKNLIWTPWQDSSTTKNGITWTVNGDGTVTANGTATDDSYFNVRRSTSGYRQLITSGLTYVLSGCPASGSNATYLLAFVCVSATFKDYGAGTTCSVDADDSGWISCIVRSGTTVSNLVFKPQLELGSVATAFEPYAGTAYTVPLGSTYYGGTLDVVSGVLTVTWHGYAFDGTENWVTSSTHGTYYRYSLPIRPNKNTTDIACTHFIRVNNLDYEVQHYIIFASGIAIFTTQTTVEDFKAWLASQYAGGTPVVACYALATPYTVQLTPTEILSLTQSSDYDPRVNTVYSDQQDVQVGYLKHPSAASADLRNALVSLGGGV